MLVEESDIISAGANAVRGASTDSAASLVRPTVSVIIVNYNTREMTLKCLRTIEGALSGIPAEIWLVDNASTDGSLEAISSQMPCVRIIANRRNVGFGAANNQAMKQATGDFVLLLNTDAFVRHGAVRTLVDLMQANPGIGVAGPRLLNADESLQLSCFRFPSPSHAWMENLCLTRLFSAGGRLGDYRRWPHDRPREVDWVVGACMMVRREAYASVGGFDERFFMYAEETDWQCRIRVAGWRVHFTPDAQVIHLGGGSVAGADSPANEHFFQSLDRYELKHHGVIGWISLRLAMVVGSTMRAILWAATGACRPSRRRLAWTKAAFHCRLALRQATEIPSESRKEPAP
ncbi:MAG TPA: glycosyltransferase family 2 protein [Humisphaera sp.]|nr:glycosyltransferase family 2 protein [Humisphaera sp.]